jgi:hypothetical protein
VELPRGLVGVPGHLGPVEDLLDEEPVCLHDLGRVKCGRNVLGVVHRRAEGVLVTVGGPDLVHVIRMLGDAGVVEDQDPQCLSIHRCTVVLDDVLGRVEQELQSGQSLLAVDDVTDRDEPGWTGLLVQDHRTEEVRWHRWSTVSRRRRVQKTFGQQANVFPQRSPLVVCGPHVGPLEQRHDVPDVVTENIRR